MKHVTFQQQYQERRQEIASLFAATFTASEGAEEGQLIGGLAHDLLTTTPAKDLLVFTAESDDTLIGAIFFSRLIFEQDERVVFVLAPVAVRAGSQAQGVGQALIRYGLNALREAGVDAAFTYGDPNYYSKVGFAPVSEAFAKAPFDLQLPEGWLAQSLKERALAPFSGQSRCVSALNAPTFW